MRCRRIAREPHTVQVSYTPQEPTIGKSSTSGRYSTDRVIDWWFFRSFTCADGCLLIACVNALILILVSRAIVILFAIVMNIHRLLLFFEKQSFRKSGAIIRVMHRNTNRIEWKKEREREREIIKPTHKNQYSSFLKGNTAPFLQ